jgi:hypothetical protein
MLQKLAHTNNCRKYRLSLSAERRNLLTHKLCAEYLFWAKKVRCSFSDGFFHSRMPLDPTPVRLKLLHACDQWHSSRKFTLLPFGNVNSVTTLKANYKASVGVPFTANRIDDAFFAGAKAVFDKGKEPGEVMKYSTLYGDRF